MTKAPNELYDAVGTLLIETVGVCDGMEALTERLWALGEPQRQALLDIADYAVEPGADPMQAVIAIQKIAVQGLMPDGLIPVYATKPAE